MSQYCAAYLLSKYNGNRDKSTNAEWCVCLNSQFDVNDLQNGFFMEYINLNSAYFYIFLIMGTERDTKLMDAFEHLTRAEDL